MDNLTHTLTAVALAQAGLGRKTRFATLALLVGSNLSDVDLVSRVDSTATYLKYHRGFTHSILGVTLLAGLLAATIFFLGKRAKPRASAPPLDLRWLFAVSWIATASHLLLDFTNSYGVRPFLPFSGRWYAWDIMFIVDPLLWGLLLVCLGVPAVLSLVSEEVGARKPRSSRGAIVALCSLVLVWGVRDLAHRRVLSLLDSHTYGQETPRRLGAFPSPANPFAWTGVIETDSAFHVLPANALDSDVDAERTLVFRKIESSPPLEAALKTRTAAIFCDFARFPWAEVMESEDGYRITVLDLRFIAPEAGRRAFITVIELDKNLRVLSESFSFSAGPRPNRF